MRIIFYYLFIIFIFVEDYIFNIFLFIYIEVLGGGLGFLKFLLRIVLLFSCIIIYDELNKKGSAIRKKTPEVRPSKENGFWGVETPFLVLNIQ